MWKFDELTRCQLLIFVIFCMLFPDSPEVRWEERKSSVLSIRLKVSLTQACSPELLKFLLVLSDR